MRDKENVDTHYAYLKDLISMGIQKAHPSGALAPYLPKSEPSGKTYVIGAGKASVEMANAALLNTNYPLQGAVVTRYGHGQDIDTGDIEILYSAHPVPDENSLLASQRIMNIAKTATTDDRVLCFLSGGGSSLLVSPAMGLELDEIRDITRFLVKSGVSISEINCVRRHLSAVKGGRLAKLVAPAQLITFAISDVVGDRPEDIASGPTVSTPHDPERAIAILEGAGYDVPDHIRIAVMNNRSDDIPDSSYHIIAKSSDALDEIKNKLISDGWIVQDLGYDLSGDAAVTGSDHAAKVKPYLSKQGRYAFISGGELTVDVTNDNGDGGPNLEYLAALLQSSESGGNFEAMACDSDGIDGSKDNAGGYINGQSKAKIAEMGLDLNAALASNNTYDLFSKMGQLVITGPSGTNVNDLRIILISNECEAA